MTKELDRRFRHVGRIKRSWGTTHKPTIRLMESMMTGLFERGRLDILRSIQDGTYSPLQVYDAYRTNDLERLPTAATLAPLRESMEKWIAKKECANSHRLSLKQSLRHLLSCAAPSSSVDSLAPRLALLRDKLSGRHPRSFNLARAAAQAFVKSTLRKSHPIYAAITDIEPLPVVPQRKKHPATAEELGLIAGRMPRQYHLPMIGMAVTGMGPSEFWGSWEVRTDRILIHGTKRAGRERFVPLFQPIFPPTIKYAAFRRGLAKYSDLKPYDLRRTYANWLEAAGIPRTRRKLYLGHGARDVTDLYEWQQVEEFLAEDAKRLEEYVFGANRKRGLKLEKKA